MPDPVAAYEDYIPFVMVDLPGCTDTTLKVYLQQAGRQFCIDSGCWLKELTAINLVADQQSYYLDTEEDAYTQRVMWVKQKTATANEFQDLSPLDTYKYELRSDNTLYFTKTEYTAPESITSGLQVKVLLRPELGSESLPEHIWDRYSEGILSYTRWKLMQQENKPWSNLLMAQRNEIEYKSKVTKAKMDLNKEFKDVNLMLQLGNFR